MSDTFETSVGGIDCKCRVTSYIPGAPAKLTGHPDTWHDGEDSEFEFELLDESGERADWLEDDLTPEDCSRLEQEYIDFKNQ